jgi:predicted DCC family thiol-disulfide oxidoreductase YuxK
MNTARPIWLYDGVCILCSGAVQYFLAHEKNTDMRFVAIQSGEGRELAKTHGIDPDKPLSFLVIQGGQAYTKFDGVLALLDHINGPARIVRCANLFPRFMRNAVYDVIAKHRYRIFGKYAQCQIPDTKHRARFVLPGNQS